MATDSLAPIFVSVDEAATLLGLTPPTVRRMVAAGEIPARRFRRRIRIPLAELPSIGEPAARCA